MSLSWSADAFRKDRIKLKSSCTRTSDRVRKTLAQSNRIYEVQTVTRLLRPFCFSIHNIYNIYPFGKCIIKKIYKNNGKTCVTLDGGKFEKLSTTIFPSV